MALRGNRDATVLQAHRAHLVRQVHQGQLDGQAQQALPAGKGRLVRQVRTARPEATAGLVRQDLQDPRDLRESTVIKETRAAQGLRARQVGLDPQDQRAPVVLVAPKVPQV